MSLATLPLSISGFTLLPVTYSPTSYHILYIRLHVGPAKKSNDKGKQTWPEGRTLFMVNVPPDATEREIILLFQSSCGTIEKIVFDSDRGAEPEEEQEASESENEAENEAEAVDEEDEEGGSSDDENPRKKRRLAKNAKEEPRPPKVAPLHPSPVHLRTLRRTGRNAHIVFTDASSIDRALALSKPTKGQKAPQPRPWPVSDAPHGLAHYTALYDALRPPLDAVRQHADTFMELYDYNEAKRKRALQKESKYRKGEALVDEEGFTLVTRGGAYGQAVGGGVGVASKKWQSGQAESKNGARGGGGKRKRKEKQEKDGFYAFQQHEKKRKELMDLKKKWEEDKAKVEKLKSSRKFRPY